jgi:hypothetical protein
MGRSLNACSIALWLKFLLQPPAPLFKISFLEASRYEGEILNLSVCGDSIHKSIPY